MSCPSCGEPVTSGDSYCEACGAELVPPKAAEPTVVRSSDATTCPTCGAPGEEASPDGYCGRCGRRWSPRREHDELVDGPLAGVTDRGIDHWRNEDAIGLCSVPSGGFALVVCDGVSASQEPHLVSQAAVDAAVPVLRDALVLDDDLEIAMLSAVAAAQVAAAGLPYEEGVELGPGACTFVGVVVRDGQATFGTVGDSRAYWVDAGGARQIGRDDSLAAELVANGRLTPQQAMASPAGHAITKWLGVDSVDPSPLLTTIDLPGPGLVLAVSDGLWNYAPDDELLHRLVGPVGSESALGLARRLTAYAEGLGGADNITVAVGPHGLDLPIDGQHGESGPSARSGPAGAAGRNGRSAHDGDGAEGGDDAAHDGPSGSSGQEEA